MVAAVVLAQLSSGALVRPAIRSRHEHAVLAQCGGFEFAFTHDVFVFRVTRLRFGRGTAPRRDCSDLERIKQAIAHDLDSIPYLHACPGRRAFAV